MDTHTILLVLILIAGLYMAWNIGANDVANAMGTSVGSGALTLKQAILVAAVLEFSGSFFFGAHVSSTLQSGIIQNETFANQPYQLVYGMLAALIATGAWLQVASYYGWPVSTTHAIVGGVIGFGAIVGGIDAIQWNNVSYIVSSWVLSPIFGGLISYWLFMILRKQVLYTANPVEKAKQLLPILVFCVLITLCLILFYSGFHNIDLGLGLTETAFICLGISSAGSLVSYVLVQRIQDVPVKAHVHPYSDEVFSSLEKAKKQLQQVEVTSRGQVQYQVSQLIGEIDNLSSSLKPNLDNRTMSQEFLTVERIFGYLQILSACLMAFAHGANDVANAIGPLSAAIDVLNTGMVNSQAIVPTWALALGGIGIVIGLATWGWRVILTIGKKITELTPTRGFAAEFGAAFTILAASRLGMPISTTHTLVGSVIGVGMARGLEALDLSTIRYIIISWIVTIPISAAITVAFFYCLQAIFG